MSEIVKCTMATTWKRALNAARQTVGKNELIMSGDYKNLRKNVSRHRNNGDAEI